MAIAHDANTRFPSGAATDDTTTGDRTFTHTPTGTPKGAVVAICCTGTSQPVTGVLYGGTAMTLSTSATDTTEAGSVWIYTLTNLSGLSGAQTITLQGCIAAAKWCTCSTVTAATATTRVNTSNAVNTTTAANPSVSLTTTRNTNSYGAMHSGAGSVGTAGTGCTLQHNRDYGALIAQTLKRTSDNEASGTITLSITLASDDYCIAAVALAEQFEIDAQPGSFALTGVAATLEGPPVYPPPIAMARFRS